MGLMFDYLQEYRDSLSRMQTATRSTPEGRCKICKKRGKLCCDNCKSPGQTIQPQAIVYCTEKCKANDSTTHEEVCSSRKDIDRLVRIAAVLQKIFFTLRQNSYNRLVTHVENTGDQCAIFVKSSDPKVAFYSLPDSVLQSEKLKAVALAYFMCGWSVSKMWSILSLLVKDLGAVLKEAHGSPTKCPREAYLTGPGNEYLDSRTLSSGHVCYLVRLKDGTNFALDLTGAQYGIHDTLVPWKKYKALLGFETRSFTPGGTSGVDYLGYTKAMNDFSMFVTSYVSKRIQESMDSAEDWLGAIEGSVDKLMEEAITEAFRVDGKLIRQGGQAIRNDLQGSVG